MVSAGFPASGAAQLAGGAAVLVKHGRCVLRLHFNDGGTGVEQLRKVVAELADTDLQA